MTLWSTELNLQNISTNLKSNTIGPTHNSLHGLKVKCKRGFASPNFASIIKDIFKRIVDNVGRPHARNGCMSTRSVELATLLFYVVTNTMPNVIIYSSSLDNSAIYWLKMVFFRISRIISVKRWSRQAWAASIAFYFTLINNDCVFIVSINIKLTSV